MSSANLVMDYIRRHGLNTESAAFDTSKDISDLVRAHKELCRTSDPSCLSDRELFYVLKATGRDCGSVTANTRRICEKRARAYLEQMTTTTTVDEQVVKPQQVEKPADSPVLAPEPPFRIRDREFPANRPEPEVKNYIRPEPEVKNYIRPEPEVKKYIRPEPEVNKYIRPEPEVKNYIRPEPEVKNYIRPEPEAKNYIRPEPEAKNYIRPEPEVKSSLPRPSFGRPSFERRVPTVDEILARARSRFAEESSSKTNGFPSTPPPAAAAQSPPLISRVFTPERIDRRSYRTELRGRSPLASSRNNAYARYRENRVAPQLNEDYPTSTTTPTIKTNLPTTPIETSSVDHLVIPDFLVNLGRIILMVLVLVLILVFLGSDWNPKKPILP